MTFDAKRYLDSLSMNGGSSELTKEQNAQVFAELYRRMKEPEKEAESQDGTA
ncbi:MAG: hypothetical protein WA182_13910 [Candidatus Sulfotelmatobacter sp.]